MLRIGVIGLGDMGIGLARNFLKCKFPTIGFDLRPERMELLRAAGGAVAMDAAEVGSRADTVFVMVLNGAQAWQALLGPEGAVGRLQPGSTVIVTATILPAEVRALEKPLADCGVHLIDSPVSGGAAGAEAGTLTLMAAGKTSVLEKNLRPMDAIARDTFHVGQEIGQGQITKAALQCVIGSTFAATFEALVLGTKAGVSGATLFDVIRASSVGSPLFEHCARQVLDRRFKHTGSRIQTMHKDLGICVDLAHEEEAPLFATRAAYEMFRTGIGRFPDEDNWAVAKCLEELAASKVHW